MERNKLIVMILFLMFGCTSKVIVSTKTCITDAVWEKTDPLSITDDGNEVILEDSFLEEYYDYVIRERIWTPLGQFSPETLDLKDALGEQGILCEQIKSLAIVLYNDYWDVLSGVIPAASTKSVLLYGKFKGY